MQARGTGTAGRKLEKDIEIMVKISVVIPCYNQGETLLEALESVTVQTFRDHEAIVVDDGSTNPATGEILRSLKAPETRVIHTVNQGLAAARNNGIEAARGSYILPLDADDRIAPTYLERAAAVLDARPDVGIVYCKAETFGEVQGAWKIPEYSLEQMLLDNIIFCSAMFRKEDWQQVGGFDGAMTHGWEDYDFWLSLIGKGAEVYQIPEVLFFYRVASDSMVRSKTRAQKIEMFARIFRKHRVLYGDNIEVWIQKILETGQRDHEIATLKENISGFKAHIAALKQYIHDHELHIERIEEELNHLKNSREWKLAWKLARFFWKTFRWLPGKYADRQ